MAAEPHYPYSRVIAFQSCWGCQEAEQAKEQERARVFKGYTPRNFINKSRPDLPCKEHCPDCQRLPQLDPLHRNVCQKHWKEEVALVAPEGEGDSAPTIKEIGRALPYRDIRAIREAAENFPITGQLGPQAVQQAKTVLEARREASDRGIPLPPAAGTAHSTPAPSPMLLPENAEVDEEGWLTAIEDKEPPTTLPPWLQEAMQPAVQVTALPANAAEVEKTPTQELPRETPSRPMMTVSKPDSGDLVIVGRRDTGPMKRLALLQEELRREAQKELSGFCRKMSAAQLTYQEQSTDFHLLHSELEPLIEHAHPDLQSSLKLLLKHLATLAEAADALSHAYIPDIPPPDEGTQGALVSARPTPERK